MLDREKWQNFAERIESLELSNGLKITLYEDRRLPEAAVSTYFHIGSKDEKEGERGYAHLFEHLMFEGSLNSRMDYFNALEKYGARINGGTAEDNTQYWEVVPSGALDFTLWLEADRLRNLFPYINEERLDNQKEVVKNERRQVMESEPYGISEELLPELVFPEGHPYRHPVIGYFEDIDDATIPKMKKFFDRFYVPRNASLAIAGDFDKEMVLERLNEYYGTIDGGKHHPPMREWVPRLKGVRSARAEDNVELTKIFYSWPAPSIYSRENKAFYLLARLMSKGKDSPLGRRLIVEEPLCQSASASVFNGEVCSLFSVTVALRDPKSEAKVEKIIFEEMEKLGRSGPRKDEIENILRGIEAARLRGLQNLGGFGGVADFLNYYQICYGAPGYFLKDQEDLFSVSSGEIVSAISEWLPCDSFSKLSIRPKIKRETVRIEPPKVSSAVKFNLKLPAISKLGSGMELWQVGEKEIPHTTFQLIFRGGASLDPSGLPGLACFTLDMLDEGAAGESNIEISKKLKKMGAFYEIKPSYSDLSITVGVPSGSAKDAAEALAAILLRPDFPEKEIDRIKQISVSTLKSDLKEPSELGRRVVRSLLYGVDDPYGHPISGKVSSLEKITREITVDFYKRNFTAGETALIVVGDLDDALFAAMDDIFRDYGSGQKPVFVEPGARDEGGKLYCLKMDGVTSTFVGAFFPALSRLDPRFPSISLFNAVYGGKFSSRLMKRMREEKGYTYGVNTFFGLQRGTMPWFLNAMVEKGKEGEAVTDILEELDLILGPQPPSGEEFSEARSGYLAKYFQNFETQQDKADNFGKLFSLSFPLSFYDDTVAAFSKATLDEMIANSKTIFKKEKMSFLLAGDVNRKDLKGLPFGEIIELDIAEYI